MSQPYLPKLMSTSATAAHKLRSSPLATMPSFNVVAADHKHCSYPLMTTPKCWMLSLQLTSTAAAAAHEHCSSLLTTILSYNVITAAHEQHHSSWLTMTPSFNIVPTAHKDNGTIPLTTSLKICQYFFYFVDFFMILWFMCWCVSLSLAIAEDGEWG